MNHSVTVSSAIYDPQPRSRYYIRRIDLETMVYIIHIHVPATLALHSPLSCTSHTVSIDPAGSMYDMTLRKRQADQ